MNSVNFTGMIICLGIGVVVCKADTTMEQLQHFGDLCR
jgi:hypothetical protein